MTNRRALDNTTPKVLAYVLLAMVGVTEVGLFVVQIPVANKDLINAIVQTLLTVTVAAVSYYHGSSAGVRATNEQARMLLTPAPATEPSVTVIPPAEGTTTTLAPPGGPSAEEPPVVVAPVR